MLMCDSMGDEGLKSKRIRIPLGLVTNAIYYGSLYGRGNLEPLIKLKSILEPHNLTVDDVKKAIKTNKYRIVRHKS